jgi:hypothetical protein
VVLTRKDFVGVVKNAVAGLGFAPDIAMVVFPIDMFLVGADISQVERDSMRFTDGLTVWEAPEQIRTTSKRRTIEVDGKDYRAAFDNFNTLCLKQRWGDGLPLVPPTTERVDWILQGTDQSPDLEVGRFMPRGGVVTIETLAVSLAMAGGRPEYLPVLEAAVRAIFEPVFQHEAWQTASSSTFPVVIVSGPAARQIRINHGFGLLGPDPRHPAGGIIGRALRLLQQNVGGALPGIGTMSMFGGMRYTNAVFAEDEEGLPLGWEPFNSERFGYTPGTNSLAVNVCSGAVNIPRRGMGAETLQDEAEAGLLRLASHLRAHNTNGLEAWHEGTPGILVMSRPVAKQLAGLGYTKRSIRQFLWDHTRVRLADLEKAGMIPWMERAHIMPPYQDPWPITAKPENIAIVVAGGMHPTHNFWMQTSLTSKVIGAQLNLPSNWCELLMNAQQDLGYYSE